MTDKKLGGRGEWTSMQVAAAPVRVGLDGDLYVLLVTSRETRRWIIPKGWPMPRRKDHDAAAIEAFEEAGVKGRVHKRPLGSFAYEKRLADESVESCRVTVYRLDVKKQLEVWPEAGQRDRRWCSLNEAMALVAEPELKAILCKMHAAAQPTEHVGKRSRPALPLSD